VLGSFRPGALALAVTALVAGVCVGVQLTAPGSASSAQTAARLEAPSGPEIATGYGHSCEIRAGRAYCWGLNASGELGDNSTVNSSGPVPVYTGGVLAGVTLTQISAGDDFTCALASTGAAYCWGGGGSGQLGTNAVLAQSDVPAAVYTGGALAGVTLTQITVGHGTACALASTGAAYCWGLGTSGQLGNNLRTSSAAPVLVSGGLTLAKIDVGKLFACGLTGAGAAYCWGGNASGELGNGSTTPSPVPVAVTTAGTPLAGVTLTQVSAGAATACALSSAGAAYCWGNGGDGQLGNGSTTAAQTTAVAVTTTGALAGVTLTQLNAGDLFTCALGSGGAAYCWGIGRDGDLADNSTAGSLVPVPVYTGGVLAGVTLTKVSPGDGQFACALDTTGTAYCWGTNSDGQAGNPDTAVDFLVPAAVAPSAPNTVAAGNVHSCEIDQGKASCWGDNSDGELGNKSTMSSSVPVAVWTGGALSGVTLTQITAGADFSCALSAAGAAYCWGLGASGQLGDNSTAGSSVPVAVSTSGALAGVTLTRITASGASACALASTGAAFCWGAGGSGQLGDGTTTAAQSTPVPVSAAGALAGLVLTGISAGGNTTCALASAGAAFCWGAGGSGQLGDGTTTAAQSTPVPVSAAGALAGLTLTGLTNGADFACALAGAGAAFCWGAGGSGQLGDGTTAAARSTPVAVSTSGALAGVTLTQIDAGSNSSCALSGAGAAFCWGAGGSGQLGDGTITTARSTPVAVSASGTLAGQNLTQIAVGAAFVCALGNTRADFCWGGNGNGQDGNPDTADNFSVPVAVTDPATLIASGVDHSCLLRNGRAYCWGGDGSGQLGNGVATGNFTAPVAVTVGGSSAIPIGTTLIQITAADAFTCALASTGATFCWGAGGDGQLGNSTTACPCADSDVPVLVQGGLTFTQISAGTDFACGLTSAGAAYCWGANGNGELANGGTTASNAPGPVTTGGTPIAGVTLTQISSGDGYACALGSAGAAYCWGDDTDGELGNGAASGTPQTTAVAVSLGAMPAGTTLTQITVTPGTGALHSTCALSTAGAAYCWGDDTDGELGNGAASGTPQTTAVAVSLGAMPAGTTLAEVTAGDNFACALSVGGAAYCWGLGAGGQLGNGGTASSDQPAAVTVSGALAGVTLSQISSGQLATCAQDTTGAFYCWGGNGNGQLGDASTTSSDVPVVVQDIVPGPPTGVSATPGDTTATISWTAPASLGSGTLTGYTATATAVSGTFTCTTTTALTCVIVGLTDGTTYSVTVITLTSDGNSPPSSPAVDVDPAGFLQLTAPTSLAWAVTGTGLNQSAVDPNSADQQLTATDTTATGAGWHITVSATTFTSGPNSLPDTGAVDFTGSVSSSMAVDAPTATCVGSCTRPTDTTTYPVVMATAVSLPAVYTVYDTAVGTGEGVMTIGGSGAANPIGWWVQVPADAYAGVYTSTVALDVVSGP
jgi:alpha-tubulin suppressor-like RCC1 family protein